MARYTQTKISRIFEDIPILDKDGKPTHLTVTVRRVQPIPPKLPEARRFKELPYPVMVVPGQRINLYKEYKRQTKRRTSFL